VFERSLYYGTKLSCSTAARNGSPDLLYEKENDHEGWVQKSTEESRHKITVYRFKDTSVSKAICAGITYINTSERTRKHCEESYMIQAFLVNTEPQIFQIQG
jgi:hypothetical protein